MAKKYIQKVITEQEKYLLYYYKRAEKRIKAQLQTAISRGNDVTYLKKIEKQIENEIKALDKIYKRYTDYNLPKNIYFQMINL